MKMNGFFFVDSNKNNLNIFFNTLYFSIGYFFILTNLRCWVKLIKEQLSSYKEGETMLQIVKANEVKKGDWLIAKNGYISEVDKIALESDKVIISTKPFNCDKPKSIDLQSASQVKIMRSSMN